MEVKQDGTRSEHSSTDSLAALDDTHRRAVVRILVEEDNSVSLSLLAEWVAAETRDVSLDALTRAELEQLKIELHHNHLPKLEEAGVLEYSFEDQRVIPTDGLNAAGTLVETVEAR